ncbi:MULTISPECIES: hypothetical protein [unclassified Cryobacterium]|uniref:hypothetical protein n=1 Tax=unclassified Cryobacterium TaxID=2649013 RepID=UPI00106CDA64|nr:MULTISPECIES: hypothetical protein [unclassified Cryobacterium]TFC59412.1 hypothetical protein E3O68_00490 [Cryobacterium sp. TMB3-1-2]TFC67208.1 hypothetical protein E3T21_17185 [Cryobacterium sp. TMB3-15]TFC73279.1 hypothetical protein E3T22_16870 [Cryobacterium sp. TMB3-10]TFD46167.1 hypothetical protein E3T58_01505 [Cryobacterium sp. TMB3-12]
MSRITHPQPQVGIVTDRIGGIEFTDGVAEVDLTDKPNLREAYLQHGYVIEEFGIMTGHLVINEGLLVVGSPMEDGSTFTGRLVSESAAFKVWAGDDAVEIAPLPLPEAVEGETTERVYEFAEAESNTEAYIPPRRSRKKI